MKTFYLSLDKMRRLLLSGLFSVVLMLCLPCALSAQVAQPITICSGASIVIKGDAASPTPNSYQWELLQNGTWSNAPGIYNGADYPPSALLNNTAAPIIFSIRRQTVTAGVVSYDSYYDVTTLPSAAISNNVITPPAQTTFCSPGTPAAINGSTPAGGNGAFTYQWQSSTDNLSFSNIAGAAGLNYTPPTLLVTTYYRRVTFGSSCVATSISNVVTITVFPNVTNNTITAPTVNSFCLPSDPANITGSTPAGGTGSYTYQWQSSADGVTFTDMPGVTTKDYDPATLSVTTYYRRTATSGVCSVPVISNAVSISILNTPVNNVISAPAITGFCQFGDPANIPGNTPSGGNGVYSYQWQQSTDNINFINISGATAKDYDPPLINVTTYYRRTVVSGSCTTPVISNAVAMNVIAPPSVPLTVQPPVVTVCPGSPATLAVNNPQPGITYKWYDSAAKTNLLYTGDTYITPPVTVPTTFYVESSNGLCSSPSAASVQVNIAPTPVTPVLTNNPVSTCTGTSATLTISNPQAGVTYNWYAVAAGGTVLFSGTNFITPVLSANTTYYVEAVNGGGCVSARIAANVTILPILPVLANNSATAPAVTSFCLAGDPANITGSNPAGGNNVYTYQWQQSTDNVTFTDIPGATAKDYDPAAITVTTYYRRTISSGPCTTPTVSNSIAFSILTPPTIPPTVLPTVTVCPGSPAVLSVSNPQSGFAYNWYDSPAKTNLLFTGASYTTAPLLASKTFYVESSNGLCSGSAVASIQVNLSTPPAAPALVKDTVISCSISAVTFAISNPQAGFIYNWYSSATGGTSIATGTTFTTPTLNVNTIYYVDVANTQGCISLARTPANASLMPLPQFTTQDAMVCPGSNATLAANTSDHNIAFAWYTTLTGGTPVSTGDTLSIPLVNATVTYYVEATNTLTGCVSASRKPAQAQVLQPLSAPIVAVNSVTESSVTFDWAAVKGALTYMVSTDNGSSYAGPSSGASGLTHTVSSLKQNQSVSLVVRAMGLAPCSLSANSAAVTAQALNQTDDIYVPNAFTPNGDGNNDVVYVHSEGIKTLNFYVYNQWGQMIFSSAEKNNGWDGTFKGSKEPLGVYTYFLKAVMNNGHEVNKKGTITLLK